VPVPGGYNFHRRSHSSRRRPPAPLVVPASTQDKLRACSLSPTLGFSSAVVPIRRSDRRDVQLQTTNDGVHSDGGSHESTPARYTFAMFFVFTSYMHYHVFTVL
jgi:hypothetical protein